MSSPTSGGPESLPSLKEEIQNLADTCTSPDIDKFKMLLKSAGKDNSIGDIKYLKSGEKIAPEDLAVNLGGSMVYVVIKFKK